MDCKFAWSDNWNYSLFLVQMKTFLALLLLSPIAFAEKNEMVPLYEWLPEVGDNMEASEGLYASHRCVALFSMFHQLLLDANYENTPQIIKSLKDAELIFISEAISFYNTLIPESERDFENDFLISMMPIAKNYRLIIEKSVSETDEILNDFLLKDVEACKQLSESFN